MTAPAIDSSAMSVSVSAMQATPEFNVMTGGEPAILATLADIAVPNGECPRRTEIQIDSLLLAIEALDLTGSEA
jgi:hypothetical protein